MSRRSGKRTRKAAVDPPELAEIALLSPPESNKKARLDDEDFDGAISSEVGTSTPGVAVTSSDPVTPNTKPPSQWNVDEVVEFLRDGGLPGDVLKAFREHEIHGRHLMDLNSEDMKDMGIKRVGVCKDVLTLIKTLFSRQVPRQDKVFNDPIHGHIELHPLMVKIIDTPQFQRLRHIKQLGGSYWVFPGAAHNRFEHSIGVGFLAGELVETLQRKQPELDINDVDVLSVKVAGLCHDLGHGPFSHLFDGHFIPRVRPNVSWKHEGASVMMFEHLLKVNNLREEFEKYGLGEADIVFIKEQIAGPSQSEMSSQLSENWPYQGRPESKSFLYEIVANKRNGIDVDKWDYFARDCHCLGIPNNFDMRRYMKFARVIDVKNRRQICARDKEVSNLYEMFHTRSSLHRRAYQHKTSNAVEQMLTEALVLANDHIRLPGEHGPVKMSEAIYDPYAYTRLNDSIVHQILSSTDENLREAQCVLERIERRDLYKCLGQTQMAQKIDRGKVGKMAEEIASALPSDELGVALSKEDFFVDVVTFDYGMKDENPIDHVRFYVKEQPHKPVQVRKDQVSQMLPDTFMEQSIRVYCRKTDPNSIKAAKRLFLTWCFKTSCVTPKGGLDISNLSGCGMTTDLDLEGFTPYSTPMKSDHGSRSGSRVSDGEQRTPTQSKDVVLNLNAKFTSASKQTPP